MSKKAPTAIVVFTFEGQEMRLAIYDQVGLGLSPNEVGKVKRLTGMQVLGATMLQAIGDFDSQVLAALLVVAVEREGGKIDVEKLFDGTTEFDVDVNRVPLSVGEDEKSPSTNPTSTKTPDGSGILDSSTTDEGSTPG